MQNSWYAPPGIHSCRTAITFVNNDYKYEIGMEDAAWYRRLREKEKCRNESSEQRLLARQVSHWYGLSVL